MRLTAHSDINLVRAPSNLWRSRPCDLNCLCPPRPPHTLLPPHHKIYTHIIIIWHKQDHFLSRSLQLGWKPEWSQPTTVEPFLCFIFDLLASPQRPPTVSGPHIWDHLTTQNASEAANDVIHKLGVWLFMKFRAKVPQLLVREKCQVRESRLIFFSFLLFFSDRLRVALLLKFPSRLPTSREGRSRLFMLPCGKLSARLFRLSDSRLSNLRV